MSILFSDIFTCYRLELISAMDKYSAYSALLKNGQGLDLLILKGEEVFRLKDRILLTVQPGNDWRYVDFDEKIGLFRAHDLACYDTSYDLMASYNLKIVHPWIQPGGLYKIDWKLL